MGNNFQPFFKGGLQGVGEYMGLQMVGGLFFNPFSKGGLQGVGGIR